jgi:hypothetical protein
MRRCQRAAGGKFQKNFPGRRTLPKLWKLKPKPRQIPAFAPRDMAKALPYKAREFSQK